MKIDKVGRMTFNEQEIIQEMYKNPDIDPALFLTEQDDTYISGEYNRALNEHYDDSKLMMYHNTNEVDDGDVRWHDRIYQNDWFMPDEYKELDIAEYILSLCKTEQEFQRVGEELIMFQERDLFNLLRYMKYFVDTMRENNKVHGVGRGSSVASYVLYLLGVHRIDSLFYDLSIDEFLR